MEATITNGLSLAFAGIIIVFLSLAFIALTVRFIRWLDNTWQEREEQERQAAIEASPTIDDLTMVIISAAVATYLVGRHRIKSIHRVSEAQSSGSLWSSKGRAVLQGSHRTGSKKR